RTSPPTPRRALFPYTTLFRSYCERSLTKTPTRGSRVAPSPRRADRKATCPLDDTTSSSPDWAPWEAPPHATWRFAAGECWAWREDRKSTRLKLQSRSDLVCRL